MKFCTICKIEKPYTEYHRRGDSSGYRSACKSCYRESNLKRYHTNTDTKSAHRRAAHKHNVGRYGLTLEMYDELYISQNGECKICHCKVFTPIDNAGMNKTACIDHCHDTGKVRGLLCRSCNTGIGSFKESLENIKSAVIYLEFSLEHSCN